MTILVVDHKEILVVQSSVGSAALVLWPTEGSEIAQTLERSSGRPSHGGGNESYG